LARNNWILLGNGSLLAGCGDRLLAKDHRIALVLTTDAGNKRWAAEKGIRVESCDGDLPALLASTEFDHLASIAHLSIVPAEALRVVPGVAVNFHDGPLPELAGLNVTSWAIMRGERTHGVTWHVMTERADAGRILAERRFAIAPDETAFLLNAKCYAAGLESFGELLDNFDNGALAGREQELGRRQYYGRSARPAGMAVIDPRGSTAEEICATVRALDFGTHANPLCLPKLFLGTRFVAVNSCTVLDDISGQRPGTVLDTGGNLLRLATSSRDVVLQGFSELDGASVDVGQLAVEFDLRAGTQLPPVPEATEEWREMLAQAARADGAWHRDLAVLQFPDLNLSGVAGESVSRQLPSGGHPEIDGSDPRSVDMLLGALAVLAARRSGASTVDVLYSDRMIAERSIRAYDMFATHVPLRIVIDREMTFSQVVEHVAAARERIRRRGGLSLELWQRLPDLRAARAYLSQATVAVGIEAPAASAPLRLSIVTDGVRLDAAAPQLGMQLESILSAAAADATRRVKDFELIGPADRARLEAWNGTGCEVPDACIHELFARQARLTPDAEAVVSQGRRLTYRELDERSNRLARHLRSLGVQRDVLVGIYLQRSCTMVEAVLATLKAGGAYVPLDPTYPADRLEFMIQDSRLRIVLTEEELRARVPGGAPNIVSLDAEEEAVRQLPADPLDVPSDLTALAYVIYTSGSTGRPKGVMIEHRNVTNFAIGMDRVVDSSGDRKTWLAATSLSFDISVLELLWTLARGFKVVVHRDRDREAFVAAAAPQRPLDFSLFYFSSDESQQGTDKYRLLLDGTRFADANGFAAIWTPERHFHAFGGLFPNPSVTSAAVAAITRNIAVRAGSVVSPLHSSLRIAEEWSIVDNLSNGRVGISFAPGWQPNDFVLRPETFARRKDVMFEQIEEVRRLWRGEAVTATNGIGKTVEVKVLPRPVQKELPVWVTIAGNPESFVAAAKAGAHVLTHLLGQTVGEVGEKIALYRKTWTEAGHQGRGTVTLMVHTFVGENDDEVKAAVREPMKEYLRSAVGLVKEAAWSFPTFKTKTTNAAGEFAPDNLTAEEMDALLDHAFDRYYSTSGLFGSPDRAQRFVEQVLGIDVDEVACLIDFGVPTDRVLAGLPALAQLARKFKTPVVSAAPSQPTEPIDVLMARERVTHFQCTPTMAQMLVQDTASRGTMGELRQLLVGGEALPAQLARELAQIVRGRVTNVYGPTETTVWSSSATVGRDGDVTIGHPIANTELHVVDKDGMLTPLDMPGELLIGGKGVVRGYWNRPELTAERFIPNPFGEGRLYRTGDLVRRRADGSLDFLGRLDHQVKIRGHRIELGEIEARLQEHPAVREAVVVARGEAPPELVAYVTTRAAVDEPSLREHLRSRVPEYMMPRAFMTLAAFPTTPNGKIDRRALPSPERQVVAIPATTKPQGRVEQQIAEIWQEVLELPEVGIDTNFADVGGHSLAMVRVLGKLKEKVSTKVTLVDLFRHTTIRALARFLSEPQQPEPALAASASRAASRRAAVVVRRR
jgi:natural product biosynthesis luciferase-like monooxygenase protein